MGMPVGPRDLREDRLVNIKRPKKSKRAWTAFTCAVLFWIVGLCTPVVASSVPIEENHIHFPMLLLASGALTFGGASILTLERGWPLAILAIVAVGVPEALHLLSLWDTVWQERAFHFP